MTAETTTRPTPIVERGLFIDGSWRPSADGGVITVMNPATEEVVGHMAAATTADVDAAVAAARAAFDGGPWPGMTMAQRVEVMLRFADELEADADAVTELLIAETGLARGASRGGAVTMPGRRRDHAGAAP